MLAPRAVPTCENALYLAEQESVEFDLVLCLLRFDEVYVLLSSPC
jgi:hypothetical protein